jgi:peptide/nickel transport system permease protein
MTDELPPGQGPSAGKGHLEELAPGAEEQVYAASQWKLMWWKFRKHKLALVSAIVVILLYLTATFCEFVAPYPLDTIRPEHGYAPPQRVRFFAEDGFHLRPFVYALDTMRNPETLARIYRETRDIRYPIHLFERGGKYKFWGLFETDWHLFGVKEGGTLYLLGTDALGRDMLSRIIYGARISLTIGIIGVALSFVIGLTMGCISGYYGGTVDHIIQRTVEVLRSFPTLPLWMALAAALPRTWSPLQIYFGITIVLSFIGWTGLARQVRGKILSLREEDFAMAAMLSGASEARIMWRHLLPSFFSHIIVVMTMAVPRMIIGETSLSFLGLGLRPPITSWGVLLKDAQNIQALELHPWLLTPVFMVIVSVLALNFVGDGLRDAADPYSR